MEWEGYSEMKMKSDGNYQFRALADQLYKSSDYHKRVRQEIVKQLFKKKKEIVKQLKSRPKIYKNGILPVRKEHVQ